MAIRQFLVPLLYLVALAKIQTSSCLCLCSRQRHHSATLIDTGMNERDQRHRRTQLLSRKSNDDDDDTEKSNPNRSSNSNNNNKKTPENSGATTPLPPDVQLLMDPGLWTSDFLAILLASQLIGLLDVVNSAEFIQNGGWFQPIPAVPSTLDDLVLRISSFAVLWAIASASVISFAKKTTTTTTNPSSKNVASTTVVQQQTNRSDGSDTSEILKRNIQTLVVFGVLQIVGNGIILGMDNSNDGLVADGNAALSWLNVLRNCYYVGLSTSGLRFLYGRYFLLS